MALPIIQLHSSPRFLPFSTPLSAIKLKLNYSNERIQCLHVSTSTNGAQIAINNEIEVPDRRRLIAQNVPWDYTDEDIKRVFEKHGSVLDVEFICSVGFVALFSSQCITKQGIEDWHFVTMSSEEEATSALNNLNSYDLDGRMIKLDYAKSTSKKNPPSEPEIPKIRYAVYAGNLAWRVRSQDLRDFFKEVGNVLTAEVIYQSKPRRPAGYGFVSFASKEEAEAAISTLNGKNLLGRTLRLGFSKLKTEDAGNETTNVTNAAIS